MDMRILPRYPVKDVLDEINRITGEVAAKHKVPIEYGVPQAMESPPTQAQAPLVKALSAAVSEVYGVNPKPVGIGGGTVAAHLRKTGIDCAVWAKLGDCAHQPDEYVFLDNITGDAKVMARLLM
jgi:succinyl-diaminopimelate desuccinylase